jgi:hypothetical protein
MRGAERRGLLEWSRGDEILAVVEGICVPIAFGNVLAGPRLGVPERLRSCAVLDRKLSVLFPLREVSLRGIENRGPQER